MHIRFKIITNEYYKIMYANVFSGIKCIVLTLAKLVYCYAIHRFRILNMNFGKEQMKIWNLLRNTLTLIFK